LLRLTARCLSALLVVCAAVMLMSVPALAGHTHTVNGVYHGLGDGNNDNYYVHAFVDYPNGAYKGAGVVDSTTGNLIDINECYCSHAHTFTDLSPYRECYFDALVASQSPSLGWHYHWHHNYC
jgi:hypothetical protein